jgi:hypothetical protein
MPDMTQVYAAIDKLTLNQTPRSVFLTPASSDSPCVEVPKCDFDGLRDAARAAGIKVPADRGRMSRLEADIFAAAIKRVTGLSAAERGARKAVLSYIANGVGLSVRLTRPALVTQESGGGRPGRTVILDSAQDPNSDSRVTMNEQVWGAICRLANQHGYAVSHELLLPLLDARLLAAALRKGAGSAGGVLGEAQGQVLVWRIIALLDAGSVVITRREN